MIPYLPDMPQTLRHNPILPVPEKPAYCFQHPIQQRIQPVSTSSHANSAKPTPPLPPGIEASIIDKRVLIDPPHEDENKLKDCNVNFAKCTRRLPPAVIHTICCLFQDSSQRCCFRADDNSIIDLFGQVSTILPDLSLAQNFRNRLQASGHRSMLLVRRRKSRRTHLDDTSIIDLDWHDLIEFRVAFFFDASLFGLALASLN